MARDLDRRRFVPDAIRQLWLLLADRVTLRGVLLNRYTLMLVLLVGAVAGVATYTSANDEARIHGTVVTEGGEPVADATVTLARLDVGTVPDRRTTTTDDDGAFAFEDQHDVLEFRIWATAGDAESERKHLHLLYRSQSRDVTLVLGAGD